MSYIEDAHRTTSNSYYGHRVNKTTAGVIISEAIYALQQLDALKKALFYGRNVEKFESNHPADEALHSGLFNPTGDRIHDLNLLHGIIGVATESGELLEALYATMFEGKPFDTVNAGEEVGDAFWYQAHIARAIGSTFERIQDTNIAKLRKRFPDRFTERDAIIRDLSAERKVLEQS